MGPVIRWTNFTPGGNSPRNSVSMQGRYLGESNCVDMKTQELRIYLEGDGRILEGSMTKTSGEMANLKVYSRRSQKGVHNQCGGVKGVSQRCLDDTGERHKIEDLSSCSSQSLRDFSSDYSDVDGELERRPDMSKEHIREESEEAGLEGLRYLLGSHDFSLEGETNNEAQLCERLMEFDCSVKPLDKQGECSKGVLGKTEIEQNYSKGEGAEKGNVLRKNVKNLA